MSNITSMNYMESIVEQIKNIDTDNLPNIIPDSEKTKSSVVEEQKIYFWIRLHLKDGLQHPSSAIMVIILK